MAVIDGLTSARAHLDPLKLVKPGVDEINHLEILGWLRTTDPNRPPPVFAGRYFLGHATAEEVDAGKGFCLWAHGEAAPENVPHKIVPIQRAAPDRQTAVGELGIRYGREDAAAIARHLDLCLAVGDLELGAAKQILVFLEVDDDTPLSPDYWAAWATTLSGSILIPARLRAREGVGGMQPLLPAILCAFRFDGASGAFLPDPAVASALDVRPPAGMRHACLGFWARRKRNDPNAGSASFGWSTLGEARQSRWYSWLQLPISARIPVRYLRWFDGPEGLPIEAGALRDTLSLVTLDWAATDPGDDPLVATMTATGWRADAIDLVTGLASEPPIQFGVDKNRDMTRYADCLAAGTVNVPMMPAAYSWTDSARSCIPRRFTAPSSSRRRAGRAH